MNTWGVYQIDIDSFPLCKSGCWLLIWIKQYKMKKWTSKQNYVKTIPYSHRYIDA